MRCRRINACPWIWSILQVLAQEVIFYLVFPVRPMLTLWSSELLCSFLDSQPPSLHPRPRRPHRGASQPGPPYRVREIVHRLGEAEVHGDQRTVRRLTALLKDRRKIPAKVFVFTENIRPGYIGK